MTDEEKAAHRIHIAKRIARPLAGFQRSEEHREVLLDLLTATTVWFANVPEEEAISVFRNCLRFVRGEAFAEPQPPVDLN